MSGRPDRADEDAAGPGGEEVGDRLPRGARVGIGVLLVTAVLAGVAAVGAQALVDGTRVTLPVPEAAQLRDQLPVPADDRSGSEAGSDDDSGPTNRASQARPGDVDDARSLLTRQAKAIRNGDREAYLRTIDAASPGFVARAERTFDNLAALPVRDVRFGELIPDGAGPTPDRVAALGTSAWMADVSVDIQLAGDSGWWSTALRPVFVRRDGDLFIANDSEGMGGREPRPIWMLDDIHTVEGDSSLVIGTGPEDRLAAVADAVDSGVPEVSRVWHRHWPEHVVVIAPSSQEQMEQVIGAEPGSQEKVAAVTTSVGRLSADGGSHIVVNPDSYEEIGARSQQVVLTHEAVHVATDATVTSVPVWLSEGLADYVGFKGSGLDVATVAQGLLADVRKNGPPAELPDSLDFDPRQPDLDRAYESAWLACVYIAETVGEPTLVEFYEAMGEVATDADEERVYRQLLGHTPDSFVAAWQDYLVEKAAG